MKIILILLAVLFIISSCATMKGDCPPENVVIGVPMGNYIMHIVIEKAS